MALNLEDKELCEQVVEIVVKSMKTAFVDTVKEAVKENLADIRTEFSERIGEIESEVEDLESKVDKIEEGEGTWIDEELNYMGTELSDLRRLVDDELYWANRGGKPI